MKRFACFFVMLVFAHSSFSQTDTTNVLGEVFLQFSQLKDSAYTTNSTIIGDSVLKQNQASLTNLLNYNSPIYFKENGLGMVSSPSFRGTTASQTAVLWNGIQINSQTIGQTDFNTINIRGFNEIEITPGGSSVDNGSGAIGGTINLINNLDFNQGFKNDIFANYGEFNTYGIDYKTTYSSEKISLQLGIAQNGSDNDYDYPETDLININGQYLNTNISFGAATKLDANNTLKVLVNIFDGRRNFSVPTPNALKTKYTDFNTRALAEWESLLGNFTSNLKVATTTEEYRYYANINNENYSFGNVNSLIAQYGLDYTISSKMLLGFGANYTQNSGNGSDIISKTRNLAAGSIRFKHILSKKVLYELSIRQEFNEDYENPLLYSAGISAQIAKFYQLKVNTSKNFRIPTFNDLYWEGLGNPNLKPETSYQGEISNNFSFRNGTLSVAGYYNSITDLLRYVPDKSGLFRPENTGEVEIYGLESLVSFQKKIGNNQFNFNATYGYTVSENKETQKQLIYVPFHKFTTSVGYSFKNFSTYYQMLKNGEVFTTSDNDTARVLNGYLVSNLGAEYSFSNKNNYKIGIQALNIWDETYQSTLNRPMPGRNFNLYINLTI